MKIWIVAAHDHIYGVDTADRALRYAVLTEVLWARGHEVRLWSSSFHQGREQQREAAGGLLNPKANCFV